MLRVLKIILGIFLIVLGLLALVTPLTPGSWLALIGLQLLGYGYLTPKPLRHLWFKPKKHCGEEAHVIIVHGIGGNPEENWFPWLKKKLLHEGMRVHLPHFPTKQHLTIDDWWKAFSKYEGYMGPQTIVVGHSLGVAFLLAVLERFPAKAAFFVAPAWGETQNEFTHIMAPIADRPFNWSAIREHCKHFTIFHADNDPYLPLERAETLARHLQCSFLVIPSAGHFNAASDYKKFPRLLSEIRKISEKSGNS